MALRAMRWFFLFLICTHHAHASLSKIALVHKDVASGTPKGSLKTARDTATRSKSIEMVKLNSNTSGRDDDVFATIRAQYPVIAYHAQRQGGYPFGNREATASVDQQWRQSTLRCCHEADLEEDQAGNKCSRVRLLMAAALHKLGEDSALCAPTITKKSQTSTTSQAVLSPSSRSSGSPKAHSAKAEDKRSPTVHGTVTGRKLLSMNPNPLHQALQWLIDNFLVICVFLIIAVVFCGRERGHRRQFRALTRENQELWDELDRLAPHGGFNWERMTIDDVEDRPGIYRIRGAGGDGTYFVGGASQLGRRLRQECTPSWYNNRASQDYIRSVPQRPSRDDEVEVMYQDVDDEYRRFWRVMEDYWQQQPGHRGTQF